MVGKIYHFLISWKGTILEPGDGHYGDWSTWEDCPTNSYARSFRLRMNAPEGSFSDDTALNSIRLKCEDRYGKETR